MSNGTQGRVHPCGIQTAWTESMNVSEAVAAVAHGFALKPIGFILVFFSPAYDAVDLSNSLAVAFPGVAVAGCSTSGGISPAGAIDRGLVVIAFPQKGFRIFSEVITLIDRIDMDDVAASVRSLCNCLDQHQTKAESCQRFALSLIDAFANAEEKVVSAVAWALNGIPLVGGSAGDDLTFRGTVMLHGDQIHTNAAVLVLVETDFPVRIFKTDNFEPMTRRFVVTAANEDERRVYELNAEPAAVEYATAVGLDPVHLTPMSFAANPLAVKIGGEFHCRSISRLDEDGSLVFFCAISEGAVLALTKPRDIVEAMQAELSRLNETLGGLDLVIGFNCVLRRLDAESRQVQPSIVNLYRKFNVVGFETYGEQYLSMHLNQTFTGIAIGRGKKLDLVRASDELDSSAERT